MRKVRELSCLRSLVLLVPASFFLAQMAFASTVAVGTCTTLVHFTTISQAVSAVPSGSVIKVCPGVYPEQVVIDKKLTLEGITTGTQDAVVITPPPGGVLVKTTDQRGNVAPQVWVYNTPGPVVITNLTVDGTGNQYTSDDLRGILYQDASGTVNHVAVRNEIPNDVPTGDQSGQGIFVETTNSSSASLIVENSSVHNYNKNGIVARYTGATLTATGNYVQGAGPISYIAQNGIEIAFGATGSVKNNTVIDNFYIPTSDTASDILLYDTAENTSIVVSGNIAGNSNIAIALETDTAAVGDGVTVSANRIFGTSTFDGVDVCTNNNSVTTNTIFNSQQSAVHLDNACMGGTGNGNNVTGNIILESACAGILEDSGTTGNGTPTGTYWTVPFPITSTTGACTIPDAPARVRGQRKFKP